MTLVALVALVIAGVSLLRLSRISRAPVSPALDRTFDNLGPGDVVMTPDGDFLVESREEIVEAGVRARVFALRSGRDKRWLLVPPEGMLLLASEPPRTMAAPDAHKLDRSSIELLPGS